MTGLSDVIAVDGLSFRYPRADRDAVQHVSFLVSSGGHTAILGPNGAGKTTLIRLILGLVRPTAGRVALWGRDVAQWKRRDLARRVAVVSQERPPDFPISVAEFVELGRNPHLNAWRGPGREDLAAVQQALQRTDLEALTSRKISELSGGELQRAKLARALAQVPEVLLLDEPTAHLDLGHELQFFQLAERLVKEQGLTLVTVTHSLSLAGRFADRCVLMAGGRQLVAGSARDVLQPEHIQNAFGWPVKVLELGPLGLHVVPLRDGELP
jgi:iron complex transport system ATP-binding protein